MSIKWVPLWRRVWGLVKEYVFYIVLRGEIQTFLSVKVSQHNLLICEVNLEEILGSELRSCDLPGLSLATSHVSGD